MNIKAKTAGSLVLSDDDISLCQLNDDSENQEIIVIGGTPCEVVTSMGQRTIKDEKHAFVYFERYGWATWVATHFIETTKEQESDPN